MVGASALKSQRPALGTLERNSMVTSRSMAGRSVTWRAWVPYQRLPVSQTLQSTL